MLERHAKNFVKSPAFVEGLKRISEFDDKFKTMLASLAMRDIASKFVEADRQMKNIQLTYLRGSPKTP